MARCISLLADAAVPSRQRRECSARRTRVTLPFQTGTTEARRRCGECSELLELKNGDAMRRHRQFQFLAGKVGLRVSEQWGDSTC
jgi:hypothetical protein